MWENNERGTGARIQGLSQPFTASRSSFTRVRRQGGGVEPVEGLPLSEVHKAEGKEARSSLWAQPSLCTTHRGRQGLGRALHP